MIYFTTSTPTYCFVLVLHAVFIFHSANYFPCSRLKKCSYVFLQELCVFGFAKKCCMICLLEYMLLRQTSGLGQRGLEMMPVHTYLTITRLITEGEVKDLKHLSQQVNRKNASFALQMLQPTDKAVPNSQCRDQKCKRPLLWRWLLSRVPLPYMFTTSQFEALPKYESEMLKMKFWGKFVEEICFSCTDVKCNIMEQVQAESIFQYLRGRQMAFHNELVFFFVELMIQLLRYEARHWFLF